jgi:hypothetical protein
VPDAGAARCGSMPTAMKNSRRTALMAQGEDTLREQPHNTQWDSLGSNLQPESFAAGLVTPTAPIEGGQPVPKQSPPCSCTPQTQSASANEQQPNDYREDGVSDK